MTVFLFWNIVIVYSTMNIIQYLFTVNISIHPYYSRPRNTNQYTIFKNTVLNTETDLLGYIDWAVVFLFLFNSLLNGTKRK